MTRILLANNYHYRRGGAEVVYLQQDELLQSIGYQTAHLSMHHPDNGPSDWSDYFVDEIEWGRDYSALEKLGHARTIIHSKQAYDNATRLIADSNAALLHGHNIYHHLSPSILKAATDAGIPSVITLHDYKVLCPAYSMLSDGKICEACKGGKVHNVVLKKCMKGSIALSGLIALESATHRLTGAYKKHVNRFISPSQFLIDKFVQWGWEPERFAHIPNCVDLEHFTVSGQVGKRLTYVGRLSAEKGLRTLIEAARISGVGLDVVGTGPLEQELKQVVDQAGADVVFHGFQTGENLLALINSARALVLPSEWYENAPISIIEAYGSGKPVIVSRIGGMPEMVRQDETGMIVEPFKPESLAQAMAAIAEMPDTNIAQMGLAGRDYALENYSPAKQAARLQELYESLGVSRPVAQASHE